MEKESLYDILNVEKTDSIDVIKKQYRNLALKYHPDKAQDDEIAVEKFKKISHAYEILSDPKRRKHYDMFGEEKEGQNMHDMHDIFRNLFGGNNEEEDEDENIVSNIELTFEEMYNGCVIKKHIERLTKCNICKTDKNIKICEECEGNGFKTLLVNGFMGMKIACSKCNATGNNNKCEKCKGRKYFNETVEIKINVPKGAHNDYLIVVNNEGNENENGERGNVVFVVKETPHEIFKRIFIDEKEEIDLSDLGIKINISLGESIIGFNREINFLNNSVLKVSVKKPTRHGDILVSRNNGMPKINSDKNGDLFITIDVQHPSELMIKKQDYFSLCKILDVEIKKKYHDSIELELLDDYKKHIEEKNMKQKYSKKHHHHHQPPQECHQM